MPAIAETWKRLLKEPAWSDHSGIIESYDTLFTYDINKDGLLDVIASVNYADMTGAGGGIYGTTVVALRLNDSLKLLISTYEGAGATFAAELIDSLIPNRVILVNKQSYCHGFCNNSTSFFQIFPGTKLVMQTSTFDYSCSENEKFRFVRLPKSDTLLIARLFERKCDPEWHSQLEKGPEKKLQIYRFDKATNYFQEWKPKDNKIWRSAMRAFGPVLEGEDLEKLKGK